ncbi:MAG: phospholipase D-like domain-containing protein [Polyangiales bacterium]
MILGFDLSDEARAGCLGFSIQRTENGARGASVWLENRLRFAESDAEAAVANPMEPVDFLVHEPPAPMLERPVARRVKPASKRAARAPKREAHAPKPEAHAPKREAPSPKPEAPSPKPETIEATRGAATTEEHPWQSFRYVDSKVEPGRTYRYRVIARRGPWNNLTSGATVDVTVTTEDPRAQATAVFFNRAAASSQTYRERFEGLDPDDLPPPRRAEARAWLSRGLEEGLLDFLALARDRSFALHVAIYEFQKPELVGALAAARARGVDVRVVYHGRTADERDKTRSRNAEAARAAGVSELCRPRSAPPTGAISHNKFVVLLRNGVAEAAWTGSTNWTDGALYGQLNLGHAVYEPAVAAKFERYFSLLHDDCRQDDLKRALDALTDVSAVQKALDAGPGIWPIFSPQRGVAALDLYARICAGATCLMVCAPFVLHESIRAVLRAPPPAGTLRFILLDRSGNLGADQDVQVIDGREGNEVSVAVTQSEPLHDFQGRLLAGKESFHHAGVHLHAKVILADPFGPDPIVVTGSANYSKSSTVDNDENCLVIRGDTAIADIYATEFVRVFDAYHFRGKNAQAELAGKALCLARDASWSERYYAPPGVGDDHAAERRLFSGQPPLATA